ncbi:MAG: acyl-CoA dehydrogenase family protein, partial [Myxococcota bacterium]
MEQLEKFREETRHWLEENCPASMQSPIRREEDTVWGGRKATYSNPDARLWLERTGERGWTVPRWPSEYGGGGLSKEENTVLQEEMRNLGCRLPLMSFGISMLGPVLLEFANEEQKREHLRKISRGEIRWCQGYSEPGSGSDLASLQMRAVLDGEEYVVNGQKIWTSYADLSDWIFCLVRTDPGAAKHDGISFLLIDMDSPGVSVAPIQLISGKSPFCQVFFQDVRVPMKNLIGKLDQGWTIAKKLLQHERSMISQLGMGGLGARGRGLVDLARHYLGSEEGRLSGPLLRDQITQIEMDGMSFGSTFRRSADAARVGRGPGPESSLFKLYGTELNKRRRECMVSTAGVRGLGWEGEGFTPDEIQLTREWLRSRGNSIEGGTSEIQLNIIAKRVLGLP